jgi:hypothetical protein
MLVTFTISFPSITLSVSDIWPDGDAPDDPTAEDVAALMEKCGGLHGVLYDWCLLDELEVNGVVVR